MTAAPAGNGAAARSGEPLLSVRNLTKAFRSRKGLLGPAEVVYAVNDVSFDVHDGETLAIVGESGCGKTTTGRSILRLIEPTSGEIKFAGQNVAQLKGGALRRMRREMQIIFQDPFSSLNPRMTVGAIIREGMLIHGLATRDEADKRAGELLEEVGLRAEYASRYPHEFSGGQRQRIGVARALSVQPRLIICDEPVSALDVSVQAQVINLLQDLQRERSLTYIFIAHDLSVVEHIADRVAVMYLGKIVELGGSEALFSSPLMPYTQALLSAAPVPDPTRTRDRIVLRGDVPSPANLPSGCVFHPRCHHPARDEACARIVPPLEEKEPGHFAACIKQPPTAVTWAQQQGAGGVREPKRYLPLASLH